MTSRRREIASRRRGIKTGSPESGEPVFLAVGKLHRPHGLRGEVFMSEQTDFPERIKPGDVVFVGVEHHPVHIRSRRPHAKGLLVAFDEYHSREDVGELRNKVVFVRADDRPPLPEGEYYHHQLIGLRVVTDGDLELGILAEILETGANDVYIVRPESGPDVLLPAIEETILDIDLEAGILRVHLLPGLLDGQK